MRANKFFNVFTGNFFETLNSLMRDKDLEWPKLKAFTDDKLKLASMVIYGIDTVENIVGMGENSGKHHFLPFPQCSYMLSCPGCLKLRIVW